MSTVDESGAFARPTEGVIRNAIPPGAPPRLLAADSISGPQFAMPTPSSLRPRIVFALTAAFFSLAFPAAARAQMAATGAIEGRVLNVTNGAYLENARVTIDGTTQQAFTNNFGEYRLTA